MTMDDLQRRMVERIADQMHRPLVYGENTATRPEPPESAPSLTLEHVLEEIQGFRSSLRETIYFRLTEYVPCEDENGEPVYFAVSENVLLGEPFDESGGNGRKIFLVNPSNFGPFVERFGAHFDLKPWDRLV